MSTRPSGHSTRSSSGKRPRWGGRAIEAARSHRGPVDGVRGREERAGAKHRHGCAPARPGREELGERDAEERPPRDVVCERCAGRGIAHDGEVDVEGCAHLRCVHIVDLGQSHLVGLESVSSNDGSRLRFTSARACATTTTSATAPRREQAPRNRRFAGHGADDRDVRVHRVDHDRRAVVGIDAKAPCRRSAAHGRDMQFRDQCDRQRRRRDHFGEHGGASADVESATFEALSLERARVRRVDHDRRAVVGVDAKAPCRGSAATCSFAIRAFRTVVFAIVSASTMASVSTSSRRSSKRCRSTASRANSIAASVARRAPLTAHRRRRRRVDRKRRRSPRSGAKRARRRVLTES